MFLRTKKIKGRDYAYLVESDYKDGRVKQKVVKYLGKVLNAYEGDALTFEQHTKLPLKEYLKKKEYHEFVTDVSAWMRKRHLLDKSKVYKVNEGYFCDANIKKLKDFDPTKHAEPQRAFAQLYIQAGLPRQEKEIFVQMFMKLKIGEED